MSFRCLFRSLMVPTPCLKKAHLAFMILLASYALLSLACVAHGFMSFRHRHGVKQDLLIRKVDKRQWKIGYRIAAECPEAFREKEPELKAAMTTALRLWLEPLRELQPARPITDDFLFLRQDDFHGNEDKLQDHAVRRKLDARITFECQKGGGIAWIALAASSDVYIRGVDNLDKGFMFGLIHELGHAFGLEDTYVMRKPPPGSNLPLMKNRGGLEATVGTQPASIMAGWSADEPAIRITEDDMRGVVWLYKHFHEGLPIEDCFFSDYVLEEDPRGCIPKYPLIFELKHGYPHRAIRMLKEDPRLDVNAQDDSGLTALHYAVIQEAYEVVGHLLSQRRIKPFLRDEQGRSALAIAREAKLNDMVTLLLEHPLTLSVHPKGKLATTWGYLKSQR